MLIEQIKKDRIQAMRDKDVLTKKVLTTLYGELQTDAKRNQCDISDANVVSKCKKVMSTNDDTIIMNITEEARSALKQENVILAVYLPAQLTHTEIHAIIAQLQDKTIPSVMPHFSKNYQGRFNGKVVKEILLQEF